MTSSARPARVGSRTVSDPLALRALAHPLRRQLYELVLREGTLTSAEAARQVDISHGLASHHLRQLGKYGFLERADATDDRARPWRGVTTSMRLAPAEPAAQQTADVLDGYVVAGAADKLAAWQARRAADDPAWAEAGLVTDSVLYLTAAEMAEFRALLNRELGRLADRRPIGHHADRPADARPISVTIVAVPLEATERGG